ncbi:MAG: hypothetical protein Tp1100DCM00d2C33371621_8 [Prokaryotic dsDNA virus sp.]|mgnify:FL=1|nr:MAG: hypothetical protein Tp1100DCM00d2C33371621_8 [Prokaryotic dsDNA virus sp.]|tara:strand:+ start:7599 stop:7826 length:228 start_codon:yes stop_codon:yes gene_type:complete
MARRALRKPLLKFNSDYQNYLVSEIEYRDGLSFKKGERIEVGGGDQTELVLVSPNGTKYKVSVADDGTLSAAATV